MSEFTQVEDVGVTQEMISLLGDHVLPFHTKMLRARDHSQSNVNKKVLLRERKRHTACRVVSTPSVVLWVPPVLTWPGGYPTLVLPPDRVPSPRPDLGGTLPW